MGMFDRIWASCPRCNKEFEFQSKAGHCLLSDYSLADAPAEVLMNLYPKVAHCKCGFRFTIKVEVRAWTAEATEPPADLNERD